MKSKSNEAVLLEANKAVSNGDYEGFLAFCTEDTHWTFVGEKILKGKEAVRQWMTETYIEPPKLNVSKLIEQDDFLVAIGTIAVKEENGKTVFSSYCDVWRLQDGKLAELNAFVSETGENGELAVEI